MQLQTEFSQIFSEYCNSNLSLDRRQIAALKKLAVAYVTKNFNNSVTKQIHDETIASNIKLREEIRLLKAELSKTKEGLNIVKDHLGLNDEIIA